MPWQKNFFIQSSKKKDQFVTVIVRTQSEVPSSLYFQLKSNQEPDTNIHDSTALWLFFKIFVML